MALILSGRVAPLDPNDPTAAFQGKVYLTEGSGDEDGDFGRVAAVRAAGEPAPGDGIRGGGSGAPEPAGAGGSLMWVPNYG